MTILERIGLPSIHVFLGGAVVLGAAGYALASPGGDVSRGTSRREAPTPVLVSQPGMFLVTFPMDVLAEGPEVARFTPSGADGSMDWLAEGAEVSRTVPLDRSSQFFGSRQ